MAKRRPARKSKKQRAVEKPTKLSGMNAFKAALTVDPSVPVVLDFWAAWCGPCRAQSAMLDDLAREFGPRIRILKVEDGRPENAELVEQHSVRVLPTLFIYKDFVQRQRFDGLTATSKLRAALNQLLA